ncbi:MAG: delta-60 repeat domain-containing protein, partial [Verrucomicrobiae bacterium]|nr:delta-60 repeat domain-containing protein [Verrucomicrobiae bacterium]
PHVNGEIYAFAVQPDGKVIVAGRFNWIGGVYRTNIARLNPDGSVDLGFDAAMPARTAMDYSTYVNCVLVQPDGRIVVGGYFDSVGGQPRTNIVRLLPDGAVDQSFGPAVVGVHEWWGGVNCMALQADGKVLIAGSFIEVGGLPRTNIARLNLDGSVDAEFSPAINGSAPDSVYALAVQPDGKIIVGGNFYYVNGVYRSLLARLNADGSLDEGFAPEIEGGEWPTVEALAVQDDGKILVGGWFDRVNGALRMNLARLNADGTVDSGFVVDVNGVPESFAQQADGKILFVGGFTEVNGIERVGIARVTRDGLLDLNFSPRLDSEVNWRASLTALAVQADGRVLIGGVFDAVNGQARTNLARLVNTAAAVESLGVDGSGIVWMRTGACPEVWRTAFDYSLDGQTWHHLGPGTRVVNGWRLAGVWPPGGSVLRARGYMTGGQGNGSSWFVETQAVPVSPIRLRIERTGTNVLLSWTGGLPPYQVQRVAELTSSNYWENVGEPVWTNAVALPLGPSNAFFRVYGRAQ